jgi:phospho-N-acetylmuramoyl-pentapeptide-transferase
VLYTLLYPLSAQYAWLSWLNVLRYTSTRIIAATLTALVLSLVLYPWFIRTLQRIQLGQVVRSDGPESHLSKRGTPTMGGSLILFTLIIPTLLWADMRNPYILLVGLTTAGCGVIGFLDDFLKIRKKSSGGLPGRFKLLGQIVIAAAVSYWLFERAGVVPEDIRYRVQVPLLDF